MGRPLNPRVVRHLAPARGPLAAVLGAGVLGALLVIAQAVTVAHLVVAVLPGRSRTDAVPWALAVVGVLAARGLVGWASDVAAATAAARVGTALRRRLLAAVLGDARPARPGPRGGVPASGPSEAATGETAVLLTRGVAAAEPYLTRYLPALALAAVLPPLTVVVIATQDLLSAVIVLATLPLVPLFGALVGLATRDRAARQWRAMATLSGHFLDVVRGLPTLVAHRRARAQSARIAEVTDRYRRASLDTLRIAFLSSAVLETVATLSVALVAVTVGVRLAAGDLGLLTALTVLLLAPEAYWPLRRVGAEFHAAAEGTAAFEAADALLAARGADAAPPSGPSPAVPPGSGDLALVELAATRPGRVVPALAPLTARVPARGLVAVTGPSGCGKSTLLAALAGLLPADGAVLLDDEPVTDLLATDAWRSRIAWLPQTPVFTSGSIAENLRLGAPSATDAELWGVLDELALADRVAAQDGGLDALVGEDGRPFSAGERARLAIARVVLAVRVGGRRLVLLDEPTAHLDEITERIVTATVLDLARDAAVLAVAHRSALVEAADVVWTLAAPIAPIAPIAPVSPVSPVSPIGPIGPVAPVDAESERVVPPAPPAPSLTPDGGNPRWTRVAAPAQRRNHRSTGDSDRRTAAPTPRLALSSALGGLASASGVALTATAGWLIVQAASHPAVLTMLVAIVGVRTFGLARPALRYVERLLGHDAALRLLAARRVEVYDALVPLVPARVGRSGRRGEVLASIVDDVDAVVDRELRVRAPLRAAAVAGVLATVAAALLLPPAGALVGATVVVAAGGAWGLARLGAARAERRLVAERAALSSVVVEAVQIADELRLWQATGRAVDGAAATSDRLGAAARGAATGLGAARAWVLLVAGAGVAAVALLGGRAAASGVVSGPVLALLVLLPLALADVLAPVADAGALTVRTEAAAARLRRLARTAPAVRDTVPDAVLVPGPTSLELRGARARWDAGDRLTGAVDLTLEPGSRVALVGPSGSGKSTAAALALRFLDPAAGRVVLGGADLRRLALDDVRAHVGLVDDAPHVFATTLLENVRLARPGASAAEVEDALRRAALGPWLDALPEGLDTWLGDGHAGVSGGERARLGVARALLADAPVLVLDEPAAHLDHATGAELAREVLGGRRERAVLWITHSPTGLDLVDAVVALDPPPLHPAGGEADPGHPRGSDALRSA